MTTRRKVLVPATAAVGLCLALLAGTAITQANAAETAGAAASGATPTTGAGGSTTTGADGSTTTITDDGGAAIADGLHYVKIEEPFKKPGKCRKKGTLHQATNCVLKQVVRTDKKIDVYQKQRFDAAKSTKARKAVLKKDAAWLKHRNAEKDNFAGAYTEKDVAELYLDLSKQRLHQLAS